LMLAESLYPGGVERARLQESLGYLLNRVKRHSSVSILLLFENFRNFLIKKRAFVR